VVDVVYEKGQAKDIREEDELLYRRGLLVWLEAMG
jgi:hypothetical protein